MSIEDKHCDSCATATNAGSNKEIVFHVKDVRNPDTIHVLSIFACYPFMQEIKTLVETYYRANSRLIEK